MVDIAEVIHRYVQGGPRLDLVEHPRQRRHLEESRGAAQAQLGFMLAGVAQGDLQPRRLQHQLQQGQGEAHQHAGQQVGEDDRQGGGRVHQHRHPAVAREVAEGLEIDQLDPGIDQHPGQARHRNLPQQAAEQEDEGEQPEAVEDRRGAGSRTGIDVGRAAYDHPGHRQRAEQAAEHVADTLGGQLAIHVRARAVVQAIHRRRREQGLRTGDEGHHHRRQQQGGIGQGQQVGRA